MSEKSAASRATVGVELYFGLKESAFLPPGIPIGLRTHAPRQRRKLGHAR